VDIKKESTFRDYIRSQLFFLPTLGIISYSLYLISLVTGLILLSNNYSPIQLVTYWAIVGLIIEIPFTIYIYFRVRGKLSLKLEKITIFKYLIGSIFAFGLVFLLIEKFLSFTDSLFVFVPNLLLFVTLGVAIYLGFTLAVDIQTRMFVRSIFNEILKKK